MITLTCTVPGVGRTVCSFSDGTTVRLGSSPSCDLMLPESVPDFAAEIVVTPDQSLRITALTDIVEIRAAGLPLAKGSSYRQQLVVPGRILPVILTIGNVQVRIDYVPDEAQQKQQAPPPADPASKATAAQAHPATPAARPAMPPPPGAKPAARWPDAVDRKVAEKAPEPEPKTGRKRTAPASGLPAPAQPMRPAPASPPAVHRPPPATGLRSQAEAFGGDEGFSTDDEDARESETDWDAFGASDDLPPIGEAPDTDEEVAKRREPPPPREPIDDEAGAGILGRSTGARSRGRATREPSGTAAVPMQDEKWDNLDEDDQPATAAPDAQPIGGKLDEHVASGKKGKREMLDLRKEEPAEPDRLLAGLDAGAGPSGFVDIDGIAGIGSAAGAGADYGRGGRGGGGAMAGELADLAGDVDKSDFADDNLSAGAAFDMEDAELGDEVSEITDISIEDSGVMASETESIAPVAEKVVFKEREKAADTGWSVSGSVAPKDAPMPTGGELAESKEEEEVEEEADEIAIGDATTARATTTTTDAKPAEPKLPPAPPLEQAAPAPELKRALQKAPKSAAAPSPEPVATPVAAAEPEPEIAYDGAPVAGRPDFDLDAGPVMAQAPKARRGLGFSLPTPKPAPKKKSKAGPAGAFGRAARRASAAAPADPPSNDIERVTTVRYYEQMKPFRNFPLLVVFTAPELQVSEPVQRKVGQVRAPAPMRIRRDEPVITVVPRFPGCICVPDRIEVDVTPRSVECQFWITPTSTGDLGRAIANSTDGDASKIAANIEIWYRGKRIDRIATPTRVVTQFLARVAALAGVASPVFFGSLEELGYNPRAEAIASVLQWAGNLTDLGPLWTLGLMGAVLFLVIASGLFMLFKPRKSNPIIEFLSFDVKMIPLDQADAAPAATPPT